MTEYTTNPQVPGKVFFRCDRMRGTLSTTSCADMWRKANDALDGTCGNCMRCPLGAVHAGEVAASMSPLKGTLTCAACHRPAARLIHKHLCVSCYNRRREVVIGRNAKGTAPVKAAGLAPRAIRYDASGDLRYIRLEHTADTEELIVATLRDNRNRVFFGLAVPTPPAIRQARLW